MQLKEIIAILMTLLTTACTTVPPESAPSAAGTSSTTQTTTSSPQETTSESETSKPETSEPSAELPTVGITRNQILDGADGEIHYSYYIPEEYDGKTLLPMMVVLPGYDGMWFGEGSSDVPSWSGFSSWTKLSEPMIVVTAQLTDWHEKSARQAIELTEYFLDNYAADPSRVYAAGYSAGGETMSQAVSMRPDLYAAYLHGASQWDGRYAPIAENGVAVYIFMAENDEYYGSQKARTAYDGLYSAYKAQGWTDEQISGVLSVEIPDNEYFSERGIYGNYHGGGNVLFDDSIILEWIISHTK